MYGKRAPRPRFASRSPTSMNMFHVLGGSGVVISRVISRVTILINHIRGLTSLLIATPEPPSSRSRRTATLGAIHVLQLLKVPHRRDAHRQDPAR